MTFNGLKLVFISSSILLTACGGGGGGGGSSDNNTGGSTTPQTQTGVLFDAPIANMSYTIDGVTKTTNAQGEFQYHSGDNIIFSLGNFNFSSTSSKPLISIIDLLSNPSVDQEVVNLARFIQTIDTNADKNAIQIPDLTGLDLSGLDLNQSISDFEDDPLLQTLLNNLGETDLIDTQEAVDHLYAQAASLEFNLPDLSDELDGDGDGQIDQETTPPPPEPEQDSDGDGVNDDQDAFPNDPNETTDTDNDNIGNNTDTDDDGDGVPDTSDPFPLDGNETLDTDGDGIGNNADNDDDGDGVNDNNDDFPLDETESVDTDNDGTGDVADSDDDGDNVNDNVDNCPLTANPNQENADGDDFGDACDFDSDNDGVDDQLDNCPNIANPNQEDTDNNGQGDVCDNDADNDGVANELDVDLDGDGLIEISTLEQLDWVRNDLTGSARHNGTTASTTGCTNCNGYELSNDLNFDTNGDGVLNANDQYFDPDGDSSNKGWLPIGDETTPFLAEFEGNGFTINNLYINRSGNVGLFGVVGNDAQASTIAISNLNISGDLTSVSAASGNAGLLIGQAYRVSLDTCSVSGDIISLSGNAGGLIGEGNTSVSISKASVTADITASGSSGGLVGKGESLTILRTDFNGVINNSASNSGGVVGHLNNNALIAYIDITATINSDNGVAGGVIGLSENEDGNTTFISSVLINTELSGGNQLGGIIGSSNGHSLINLAASSGTIVSANTGSQLGGLVGYSDNLLIHGSSSDINITGDTKVGGLVGYSLGDLYIAASYATGALQATQSIGGLVGHIADSGNAEDGETLIKSYSTAQVTGNQNLGGLIGLDESATTVSASYWATDASGLAQAVGTGNGTNQVNSFGALEEELACPTSADSTGCVASNPSATLYSEWDAIDHDNDEETQIISTWSFGNDSELPSIEVVFPTN
ncbi:thrombospondin type 3 repeat-containing protein [Litoribrevibacter euphylliae]|uniref:Thrombospondin type 3 repeat-containing protein n=1 Tax=Litoribrevibacter euphylliae TaxID=1834034 RepID=A0ABV7HJZ8_9GAMM